MNQILVVNEFSNNNIYLKHNKKIKIYLFTFFVSISISILTSFYLLCNSYMRLAEANKTNLLKNKYNLTTLYPLNNNSTSLQSSDNIYTIGLIEIPEINISYPIIQNTSKELLKVSVCKFSGPFPNRIGNLSIAGHNYKNNSMFSNLYKLGINDSIYITDLNNTRLEYIIYDKYIVKETNLDCIKPTNTVEVTLITCNNTNNAERLIIKAKMKG